jgi:hypothetical protein
MELIRVEQPVIDAEQIYTNGISSDQFVTANTESITYNRVRDKCIIPVFAKDNESTISHAEFIAAIGETASHIFKNEPMLEPAIRVSHPIKGRVPEAMGKPANQLLESEKTLYYERMAFILEIPSIYDEIDGNHLSLTIGGVRAYNLENLNCRKSEERFKVFIGFKNKVCCNLCISTDGFSAEIKARTPYDLMEQAYKLFTEYNAVLALQTMRELSGYALSESMFAQMVGRAKMYNYLPAKLKSEIHPLQLGDSQVNMVVKDYYQDDSFCRDTIGDINLWKLYNLFTTANKSSYLDNFLDRNVNVFSFTRQILDSLKHKEEFWFIS